MTISAAVSIDTQPIRDGLYHISSRLGDSAAQFLELEIRRFLQSYSRRRDMPPGLDRTKYVLSKLTTRPVYYVWFNPDKMQTIKTQK